MSLFLIGAMVLRLLCLAFAVLLAVRIVAGVRSRHPCGARAILERRFVEGAINEDEYRSKRAVLEE
jgi:uncharacterized membrane protein